jgi:hypothetical protein
MERHYCDDNTDANEIGGARSMHAKKNKCVRVLVRKLNELYGLLDLVILVDRRIILI